MYLSVEIGRPVTLALEMFAIAPAYGTSGLSGPQVEQLNGKARWIYETAEAGFPVLPTIVLTHAAWDALQAERRLQDDRLRRHWVATLFRLVDRHGTPPLLVVRTSARRHSSGLMPAVTGISAPRNEAESVDPARPLARAIKHAFESYGERGTGKGDDIVIVQAMAEGDLVAFLTRDTQPGEIGPMPMTGSALDTRLGAAGPLIDILDRASGQHMACLVSAEIGGIRLVSARPVQASPGAELEAAVARVNRGIWTRRQAVGRTDPARLSQLLHPRLRAEGNPRAIAQGLGVSPGAASGVVVFTPEDAARMRARGRHCILVVTETGPADIDGMKAATGILTARGGMTSHAAVGARITGKPCVAALRALSVDPAEMRCTINGKEFRAGDRLTIDGGDGSVYAGALPRSQPHIGGAMEKLLGWSDGSRRIAVRTNAETIEAARTALSFGAEGIGLARSEHMFFSPERMVALRRLILSEDEADRTAALTGLVDYQTEDYSALFTTMAGRPVTVRLFDPPLHEFLPRSDEDIEETASSLGLPVRALRLRLDRLAEVTPLLGHSGVRLAITYPEILEMQMAALLAGGRAASRRQNEPVVLEVMVPFVSTTSEVTWIRERVMALADHAGLEPAARARYAFGTMIELQRAALRAGDIARSVDIFSFGTNDLTQPTFGISSDDAPAILAAYQRKGLSAADPYDTNA